MGFLVDTGVGGREVRCYEMWVVVKSAMGLQHVPVDVSLRIVRLWTVGLWTVRLSVVKMWTVCGGRVMLQSAVDESLWAVNIGL